MPQIAKLDSRARAVVDEGRRALRPPVGARERLETVLDARLSALPPSQVASATRSWSAIRRPSAPALALGLVVAAGLLWPRPEPAPLALSSFAHMPKLPPPSAAAPAMPSADEPALAAAQPDVSVVLPAEPQSARRTQDSLGQEVALLSKAAIDLRAGRAAQALKSLDEHRRKFPNGLLAVERGAARAQALCSLKRVDEGRAELARLAPQSPAAGRSKQVCDAMAASIPGN